MENRLSLSDVFASNVFCDAVMRERLPKTVYRSLRATIDEGHPLDENIAEIVANAMKDWATDKGATHFTHWFQPMTGITAEKHDSFISMLPDGRIIMEFSGKDLIKGEPDASSFPSGGLRATFEARGYTAWDCTSPAFVKDNTLYIPTVFYSYTGQVLDKKTPLLRSMEALSKQCLRVLRLFGDNETRRVLTTVGAEQEYFLIDRQLFERRRDLLFCGRTLFGAPPAKGQEIEGHYFGSINSRVKAFMQELDLELWRLGVPAKTEHNEAAPAQHELAPVFTTANISTDHNQLIMELMKKTAKKHNLACLLAEKPFAGVNGSGKHINWSLTTDGGQNLLDPGTSPHENAKFLTFLCAVIHAVDEYADLLHVSIASAGNDERLGGGEAPPSIISVSLGDHLTGLFMQLESGGENSLSQDGLLKVGVKSLPRLPRDTTDRNRTSPFAFTGNKFEFRMPGSSISISGPVFIMNTIVAEILSRYADRLEKAEDFESELSSLLAEVSRERRRIIFNGNNYSSEWAAEAKERGLCSFESFVESVPRFLEKKNISALSKHGVLSPAEIESRCEILFENYVSAVCIEALTMISMSRTELLPAALRFKRELSEGIAASCACGLPDAPERVIFESISGIISAFLEDIALLERGMRELEASEDSRASAERCRYGIIPAMRRVRAHGDALEGIVPRSLWPIPTYEDMMFSL